MPAPETRTKPATIREVASRAGVSTATVSRALRSSKGVEPATRRLVEEAARELRYRPSGVARSLKLRSTRTLGLIVTDIGNPYYPQIVRAVEDAARQRGYSVLLADGRRDPEREAQSLEVLAEHQVDGLLIASSALTERHHSWLDERPCPTVQLNSGSARSSVPLVLSDNEAGGRLAAQHVLDHGHRQLVYIADPAADDIAARERLAGVWGTVADSAATGAELKIIDGDGGVAAGEQAARDAIATWPETTAVICYNDLTAVGALRGLRSVGARVPGDVSVVGFDDIELAPYVDPPLTTVRQATDEMASWAVDTLLAAIEHDQSQDVTHDEPEHLAIRRIPVRLVVRESTGPR